MSEHTVTSFITHELDATESNTVIQKCTNQHCKNTRVAKACKHRICAACCRKQVERCGVPAHDRHRGWTPQESAAIASNGPWTITRPPPIHPLSTPTSSNLQPRDVKAPMDPLWQHTWNKAAAQQIKHLEAENMRREHALDLKHSCEFVFWASVSGMNASLSCPHQSTHNCLYQSSAEPIRHTLTGIASWPHLSLIQYPDVLSLFKLRSANYVDLYVLPTRHWTTQKASTPLAALKTGHMFLLRRHAISACPGIDTIIAEAARKPHALPDIAVTVVAAKPQRVSKRRRGDFDDEEQHIGRHAIPRIGFSHASPRSEPSTPAFPSHSPSSWSTHTASPRPQPSLFPVHTPSMSHPAHVGLGIIDTHPHSYDMPLHEGPSLSQAALVSSTLDPSHEQYCPQANSVPLPPWSPNPGHSPSIPLASSHSAPSILNTLQLVDPIAHDSSSGNTGLLSPCFAPSPLGTLSPHSVPHYSRQASDRLASLSPLLAPGNHATTCDSPVYTSGAPALGDLSRRGVVYVPTGARWPDGFYACDIAKGFELLTPKDQRTKHAKTDLFSNVFPGVVFVAPTFYRNWKAWRMCSEEEKRTLLNMPCSKEGMWPVCRRTLSSWRA